MKIQLELSLRVKEREFAFSSVYKQTKNLAIENVMETYKLVPQITRLEYLCGTEAILTEKFWDLLCKYNIHILVLFVIYIIGQEYPEYQNIYKHSCDYFRKIPIKTDVATDEGNSRNEIWHWKNDETGVAVQSWLWVRVELMAW